MNPFGTRGAADDLARLLDGGGAAALSSPAFALAMRLRSAGAAFDAAVAPRPEFRDALRMRLLAVAAVQAAAPATPRFAAPRTRTAAPARAVDAATSWRRRTGAVAAGAMASAVAVTGVAVAGSQSLPGDPFYGVKRTTEAFQLRTADGKVEKGTRHLDFAATRLREVRGLTLGRDAVDAGPVLGPAALAGGFTLRVSERPLPRGEALSAPVSEQVRATLAEMDAQTRLGSALLTEAYRSTRAPEPLRALSRFATRQSAGLEQLLPALPPRSRDRARFSLALLTGVSEDADELLGIGTCSNGCDPTQAAPSGPSTVTAPPPPAPCDCAAPAPAPAPAATAPATEEPTPQETSEPEPTSDPRPQPQPQPSSSSPTPSPSPSSGGLPIPLPPLPLPLPPLPVPVPTLTLAPLAPALDAVVPAVEVAVKAKNVPAVPAEPAAAPAPLPQLAPAPPRP